MIRMMKTEYRLVMVWSVLVAITIASLETIHLKGRISDERFQGAAVILLAFIKVRLIMLDFMEIRHAPIGLRIALESWVVAACGGLILMLFKNAPF